MVCFPWAIAEKKLRESLAKLRQGSREDGSSGEVQRVTRAIAHNAGFAAGVQVCVAPGSMAVRLDIHHHMKHNC